jgi:hypothetical protein
MQTMPIKNAKGVTGGSAGAGRPCRECGKPVARGAIKCKCGAYQGLHRFVPRSPGSIGATLAIVPGAALALSFVKPLWPAEVHAYLRACHPHEIVLETVNYGGRMATLEPPGFWKLAEGEWRPLGIGPDLWDENPYTRDAAVAEPGEAEPDEQRYPNNITQFFTPEQAGGQCRIGVLVQVHHRSGPDSYAGASCACEL